MSRSHCRWMLVCSLWFLATTPLGAADEPVPAVDTPAPVTQKPAPVIEKPVLKTDKPVSKEPAETLQAPREQTIYIPYEKLRQTFEKDGRGVFIPYERFQELWKAARAQERKPAEVKPPTPAVITMADSEATVGKEVVRVAARLKIDLLASGWVEVPLRLEDAGVISASLIAVDGSEEPVSWRLPPTAATSW